MQQFQPVAPGALACSPANSCNVTNSTAVISCCSEPRTCCKATTWKPGCGTRATGSPTSTGGGNHPRARSAAIFWATGCRPRRGLRLARRHRDSRLAPTASWRNWRAARTRTAASGPARSPPSISTGSPGASGLGTAVRAPQEPDGSVRDGASTPGTSRRSRWPRSGRAGSTAGPAASAGSRWTTSSTSRPAACWSLWADLYGLTGKQQYLDLMQRYDRPRLFDRLLAGEDPLTNLHANTTIPEVQAPRAPGR